MTKFTNNNNIFRVCVDIFLKLSYNVKRILSKFRVFVAEVPKIILFVMLFLIAILLSALPIGSVEEENFHGEMRISINAESEENGGAAVTLFADGAKGFCGFFTEIIYNGGLLELISVRQGDAVEELNLSYLDVGGRISVLVDGGQNSCGGEIAEFVFAPKDQTHSEGAALQKLEFCAVNGTAYTKTDCGFERLSVIGSAVAVDLSENNRGTFFAEVIFSSDGGGELCLSFAPKDVCCFSGVRVVISELYGGDRREYLVASAMSSRKNEFCGAVPILTDKKYVVVAEAVAWDRGGIRFGEEHVYIIDNGGILCCT